MVQRCPKNLLKKPPSISWTATLRLPKSSFPYALGSDEQDKYLKRCTDDLYAWQNRARSAQVPFILHDGPPYANGSLHLGHAMNKILKDIICRVQLIHGRRVNFVPGFDCHGLPIEMKALKQEIEKNESKHTKSQALDAVAVRKAARALATATVDEQKKSFRQWAIMGDWDNAWKTMDPHYVKNQLSVFLEMVKNGLIFRRYKPVHWSPSSRTALAESELVYEVHKSLAAYIKFPVTKLPSALNGLRDKHGRPLLGNFFAVIWTTTPWTLPANRAIAINRDFEYCVIERGESYLLVAKSQVQNIANACFPEEPITYFVDSIRGADLEGTEYVNVLRGKDSQPQFLIYADFVSEESGSGLVHCAPGHGKEDYEVCGEHGIAAFAPVDDNGCFTSDALPDNPSVLEGISVLKQGSREVLRLLDDKVLGHSSYSHKYPYDWRTKEPVIMRATEQWFADLSIIKERALENLAAVKFVPENGRLRLNNFVEGRSEWCISRQRAWGVPIPALYDQRGRAVLNQSSMEHIMTVIDERGIDAWWTDAEDDPRWICPDLPKAQYRRGKDTMDVWFDSGSSWMLTDGQADVYCEGTDQHRGWFQSSLLTHTGAAANKSVPPFKTVITHGMTLDEKGRKMSKSIGNGIAPSQIMDESLLFDKNSKSRQIKSNVLVADKLRLWLANNDYRSDVSVGRSMLFSLKVQLVKYRNILRMLLGSMHQDVGTGRTIVDIIALIQLQAVMEEVHAAYNNGEFHKGVKALDKWINVNVSAFYMSAIKDRLYTGDGGSVFPEIYDGLLAMLAPITPVLVEEAWDHTPEWIKKDRVHPLQQIYASTLSSVTKTLRHSPCTDQLPEILTAMPLLFNADAAIKEALEKARRQKAIGSSLECVVLLYVSDSITHEQLLRYRETLETMSVVSSLGVVLFDKGKEDCNIAAAAKQDGEDSSFCADFDGVGGQQGGRVCVVQSRDKKCERCWRYVVKDGNGDGDGEERVCVCGRCKELLVQKGIWERKGNNE